MRRWIKFTGQRGSTVHAMSMLSMVVVGATLMVAKNDKGERVEEWKGPLNGVMWCVGGRRDARATAGGGRGTRDGRKQWHGAVHATDRVLCRRRRHRPAAATAAAMPPSPPCHRRPATAALPASASALPLPDRAKTLCLVDGTDWAQIGHRLWTGMLGGGLLLP